MRVNNRVIDYKIGDRVQIIESGLIEDAGYTSDFRSRIGMPGIIIDNFLWFRVQYDDGKSYLCEPEELDYFYDDEDTGSF